MSDATPIPAIPTFEVTPTTVQLFEFSAITWNPHRIHFDAPYARDVEGYDDVLVHGPLLGAWLMRLAETWSSGWGQVASMTYRSTVALPVGRRVRITGAVTGVTDSTVAADTWVEREDLTRVCHGQVTIARRRASDGPGDSTRPG